MVQTPQVFSRQLLERAHREVTVDVTDDAAMVERLGGDVRVFMGSYRNIKVTTPEDLLVAASLLDPFLLEEG
jgi:2-C-methyl-D-erythritol 4-phosphate cytidylyltransferase